EDYVTFHEAVSTEPDLELQRAILYSFAYTLLEVGEPVYFAQFWEGMSEEQRKGPRLRRLYARYRNASTEVTNS
ncbi:MAG: hypothetical protein AAF840_10425, partial [Bacteroidota bacterium]